MQNEDSIEIKVHTCEASSPKKIFLHTINFFFTLDPNFGIALLMPRKNTNTEVTVASTEFHLVYLGSASRNLSSCKMKFPFGQTKNNNDS